MPAIQLQALKQYLVEEWIAGQAAWHGRNAVKKSRIAHTYHRLGVACFCVTLVMATLHMLGVGHSEHATHDNQVAETVLEAMGPHTDGHETGTEHQASDDVEHHRLSDISLWISFLAVILPAWGASMHAIASLLEYDRIAARSKRMAKVLERIAARARHATTVEALAAEIGLAEEMMAAENHEWVVSLKFRELVLPA